MSGYHSVSVVADAIIKGNYDGDAKAALSACVATANKRDYEGIGQYIDLGYIPSEKTELRFPTRWNMLMTTGRLHSWRNIWAKQNFITNSSNARKLEK